MPISNHFARLGAPLANVYWSWGAIRNRDQAVFLRVWQDETKKGADGRRFIRLINRAEYAGDQANNGYNERLAHLDALRLGSSGYVVICRAVDVEARPRAIESYDERDVFELGDIILIDGDEWGELKRRVPVRGV